MLLYRLTDEVYEYYKKHVKDNENVDYETARKKLTRNIHLAWPLLIDKDRYLFSYGRLLIETKGDEIVFLKNNSPTHSRWEKNERKFLLLNRKYRIYYATKIK